ncbi:MAG TPA: hypothetical protein PLI19_03755, partial [Erysipelotrichaceae bacterium]|nr:hypothetical protein [Erysipelotrichaceae bacterium]
MVFLAVLVCCFPTTIRAAAVAEVESTGNTYDTLQEALDAAPEGDTVILLSSITSSTGVQINKPVTLDGDGFVFNYTGAYSGTSTAITINAPDVT